MTNSEGTDRMTMDYPVNVTWETPTDPDVADPEFATVYPTAVVLPGGRSFDWTNRNPDGSYQLDIEAPDSTLPDGDLDLGYATLRMTETDLRNFAYHLGAALAPRTEFTTSAAAMTTFEHGGWAQTLRWGLPDTDGMWHFDAEDDEGDDVLFPISTHELALLHQGITTHLATTGDQTADADGTWTAADEAKIKRDTHGRFSKKAAIKAALASGAEDALAEFDRPTLLREAKRRGLDVPRGAPPDAIKALLRADTPTEPVPTSTPQDRVKADLNKLTVPALKQRAVAAGLPFTSKTRKPDLVDMLAAGPAAATPPPGSRVDEAAAKIGAIRGQHRLKQGDRQTVTDLLQPMTIKELDELAARFDQEPPYGRTKTEKRNTLIQSLVGYRSDSETIRFGRGVTSGLALGGAEYRPTEKIAPAVSGRSDPADVAAAIGNLPIEEASLGQARQILDGLKVDELKKVAREIGPTVSQTGKKRADIIENIVTGTVGFRLRSQERRGGMQWGEGGLTGEVSGPLATGYDIDISEVTGDTPPGTTSEQINFLTRRIRQIDDTVGLGDVDGPTARRLNEVRKQLVKERSELGAAAMGTGAAGPQAGGRSPDKVTAEYRKLLAKQTDLQNRFEGANTQSPVQSSKQVRLGSQIDEVETEILRLRLEAKALGIELPKSGIAERLAAQRRLLGDIASSTPPEVRYLDTPSKITNLGHFGLNDYHGDGQMGVAIQGMTDRQRSIDVDGERLDDALGRIIIEGHSGDAGVSRRQVEQFKALAGKVGDPDARGRIETVIRKLDRPATFDVAAAVKPSTPAPLAQLMRDISAAAPNIFKPDEELRRLAKVAEDFDAGKLGGLRLISTIDEQAGPQRHESQEGWFEIRDAIARAVAALNAMYRADRASLRPRNQTAAAIWSEQEWYEFQGRMPEHLAEHWVHGPGAAKIVWGTEGAFRRCRRALRGEGVPGRMLDGACANLYKRATGRWPGSRKGHSMQLADQVACGCPIEYDDMMPLDLPSKSQGWRGPLAPYDVATGDRRRFKPGSLSSRQLPLPLRWQEQAEGGHGGSVVVAAITGYDMDPDGVVIGEGYWLDEDIIPEVKKAKYLAEHGLIGPSVDLEPDMEVEYVDPETGSQFDPHTCQADGTCPPKPEALITQGVIAGATLVPITAFRETRAPITFDRTVRDDVTVMALMRPTCGHTQTAAVRSSWDLPVADQNRAWDKDAADVRVTQWSGVGEDGSPAPQWDRYARAFLYRDYDADPQTKAAYKLPIADVIDGQLTIVPRAVFAAAGRLDSAIIPSSDKAKIRKVIEGLYEKMDLTAPWVRETQFSAGADPDCGCTAKWANQTAAVDPQLGVFGDMNPYPADAFNVTLDRLTPITITHIPGETFSRITGHAASWKSCNRGYKGVCIPPPKNNTGYSQFHLGAVRTTNGLLPVGKIVQGEGHPDLGLGAKIVRAFYDATSKTVAFVRAEDDKFGIKVAGVIAPDVTPEQATMLLASPPSGDWRDGEMISVLAVNVPGHVVPRAHMTNGQPVNMVAAGQFWPEDDPDMEFETAEMTLLADEFAQLDSELWEDEAQALAAHLSG